MARKKPDFGRVDEIDRELREEFGRVLNLPQVARALGTTHPALQRARERGDLPFRLHRVPGKRGYSIAAREVALYLYSLEG